MRRSSPFLALILAGCATAPVSYLVAAPQPSDAAYACALRKVNELGYTVTNSNKEAGFISADKQTSGLGTKIWSGAEYHDQLTVSVYGDSASGGRKIRATAGRVPSTLRTTEGPNHFRIGPVNSS